ncbi:MAG: hypothetical protein OH316_02080 [Candidatus Parvarchaeota archaeon]|nr:hypothetical protein [Candidatus Parvarchaeota archaeon]
MVPLPIHVFVTAWLFLMFSGMVFASVIIIRIFLSLVRHRNDKAPLLFFSLQKDEAIKELRLLRYSAFFIILTGIFTFISSLFYPKYGWMVNYDIGTAVAMTTATVATIAVGVGFFVYYKWYKWFARFL